MAKSGLYALAALDGASLDPRDLAILELELIEQQLAGFAAKVVDREEAGRAFSVAARPDGLTMLLGHLDEPGDLAAATNLPGGTPPAELAAAALARFGAEAPRRMIGEWSLLDWHAPSRTLTLLMSEATRDPIFFAFDGKRVAVSAEINRLTRLPWVGRDFDSAGLLLHWSSGPLRRYMTDESVFKHVRRVTPGAREVFRLGDRKTLRLPASSPADPWRGSFDEAMGEIEALMRRIVGQHLSRHGAAASLLSGGLDSSLIAWLASSERGSSQPLSFLTSAAPDGSGIPDERQYSEIVAGHLGLPIKCLSPAPESSLYLPADRMFAHTELPVVSPRHYLYNALYEAAFGAGVELLFDGAYGELTITNPLPLLLSRTDPRRYVRAVRDWRRARAGSHHAPAFPFHARLSPATAKALPSLLPFDWNAPFDPRPAMRGHEPWGIRDGAAKNAMTPTSSPEARLRHVIPFRDRRLINLFATMPAAYLERDGLNRAPARLMLAGRLPDSIRLRRDGGSFSPDFLVRAERQAAETIDRIPDFRAVGAGKWLDLDWLERELKQLSVPGTATYARVHGAQATAGAASYFEWLSRQ